jgi:PAS domain S-box-containing protein
VSGGPDAFTTLLESVTDGIVVAGADSAIEVFSQGAERMFDRRAGDVVGEPLTVLMPERYRDLHLAGMRRLEETGHAHLVGAGPVEVHGLRRDGTEFPIELTLGRWVAETGDRYVGIIRDVSERHEAERYRVAQLGVARALAESRDVADAPERVLRAFGEALDWPLGALWLVGDHDEALSLAAIWHASGAGVPAFEALSRELTFAPGVGLPGRTWSAGRPQWIDDVTVDDNFPRVRAAAAEGLRGAVGLPLRADGRVIGVIELFGRQIRRPSAPALELMAAMTEQVAQFLERKRAEGRLALASTRERQAAEIHEHIIESLVQASQALDGGDTRGAQRAIQETLRHASRIITELRVLKA